MADLDVTVMDERAIKVHRRLAAHYPNLTLEHARDAVAIANGLPSWASFDRVNGTRQSAARITNTSPTKPSLAERLSQTPASTTVFPNELPFGDGVIPLYDTLMTFSERGGHAWNWASLLMAEAYHRLGIHSIAIATRFIPGLRNAPEYVMADMPKNPVIGGSDPRQYIAETVGQLCMLPDTARIIVMDLSGLEMSFIEGITSKFIGRNERLVVLAGKYQPYTESMPMIFLSHCPGSPDWISRHPIEQGNTFSVCEGVGNVRVLSRRPASGLRAWL